MRRTILLAAAILLSAAMVSYGSEAGTWELSEDGKYWMYFYSPGNPAEDTWIEDNGKEYYVDAKGRMKTGWVTDQEDKNRYYLGKDGAKCFNMITPDGHYLGPEGTVLKSFDTYRKKVSKPLEKLQKDKTYKELDAAQLPGFQLTDLNGDGYRDVVVMNRVESPDRVIMAAVWDPAAEELVSALEADFKGEEKSALMYHQEAQSLWLLQNWPDGGMDCFMLRDGGARFEHIWSFETGQDDWGDPEYYVNQVKVGRDEWDESLMMAKEEMGSAMTVDLLLLNEENLKAAVDQMPEEELLLWQ